MSHVAKFDRESKGYQNLTVKARGTVMRKSRQELEWVVEWNWKSGSIFGFTQCVMQLPIF
jgi:hypothetical protein